MRMEHQVRGACLCGRVRFELDLPTKWVAHCHCSMCRRAHGAAFVTWVSVPETAFRVTAGADHLRDYRSSETAVRSFCDVCGSTMLFRSEGRWKGEVHVTRANIEGEIDRRPTGHGFYEDRVDWVEL